MPPSVASTLQPQERDWVDERYGWDSEVVGYLLVDIPPHADLQTAQQILAEACAPADETTLHRELARLRVSTKSRDLDADEIAMTLQVIAEEAIEYPADVAIAAMHRWAKRETFFPSLAEIRDEMQRLGRRRIALQTALDNPHRKPPQSKCDSAVAADAWRHEWDHLAAVEKSQRRLNGPWAPPPPPAPRASYPDDPT